LQRAAMPRVFEQTYRTEDGILSNAMSVSGTVLPTVLERPLFWFALLAHLAVWLCFYYEVMPGRFKPAPKWVLEWNEVKVVTAITTFFQVFYISQCYNRYVHLYTHVRTLLTDMTLILFDIRIRCRAHFPKHAWLASRYIVAAGLLVLQGVDPHALSTDAELRGSGDESEAESEDSADEGQSRVLVAKGFESTPRSARSRALSSTPRPVARSRQPEFLKRLLRPDERASLQAMKEAEQPLVLLRWGCEVLDLGYSGAGVPAGPKQAAIMRLFTLHAGMRKLLEVIELPVPFQYFQLLNLMVCVNIFSWAYIMGASPAFGSPLVFILCELTFMGLMELASDLSNPFGHDEVDFPMHRWLTDFLQQAEMVLECRYQTEKSWETVINDEPRLGLELLHSRSFIAF